MLSDLLLHIIVTNLLQTETPKKVYLECKGTKKWEMNRYIKVKVFSSYSAYFLHIKTISEREGKYQSYLPIYLSKTLFYLLLIIRKPPKSENY